MQARPTPNIGLTCSPTGTCTYLPNPNSDLQAAGTQTAVAPGRHWENTKVSWVKGLERRVPNEDPGT